MSCECVECGKPDAVSKEHFNKKKRWKDSLRFLSHWLIRSCQKNNIWNNKHKMTKQILIRSVKGSRLCWLIILRNPMKCRCCWIHEIRACFYSWQSRFERATRSLATFVRSHRSLAPQRSASLRSLHLLAPFTGSLTHFAHSLVGQLKSCHDEIAFKGNKRDSCRH